MRITVVAAALLAAAQPAVALLPSIYGTDDRTEVKDVADPRLAAAARGVAAVMGWEYLKSEVGKDYAVVDAKTLRDRRPLRRGERFLDQTSAASCTAALVAPDVVLTAGHCVKSNPCETTAFVFDYVYGGTGPAELRVPITSVGFCDSLIDSADTEPKFEGIKEGPNGIEPEGKPGEDWALYRLKYPFPDRPLLKFAAASPAPDTKLATLGFPSGLPMKAAYGVAGGTRTWDFGTSYGANLDTFSGNSGGPVYDLATMETVGMLIRGRTDYKPPVKAVDLVTALKRLAPRNRRAHVIRYPEQDRGEAVQRVERFSERVKQLLEKPLFE